MLHWRAKLDQLRVDDIRALYRQGWSQHRLAWIYGVSQPTIYQVVHNDTWKEKQMSAKEAPLAIDLNIDRMRARIHQEMAEVCRPYYKRLEQLDAVEEFLKSEQDAIRAKNAKVQAWETRRANKKTKVRRVPPTQKLLSSGDSTGDYSQMHQREAISVAVTKHPGLTVQEITAALIEGGFPFKSSNPVNSMYIAVRSAERVGLVQMEQGPDGKNIYSPPSKNSSPKKIKKSKHAHHGELTAAVINAVANGPDEGMTRKEVFDALESSGFKFSGVSQSKSERRVTWALQSLYDGRRIDRRGSGQLAIFSRPKVTAVKNK